MAYRSLTTHFASDVLRAPEAGSGCAPTVEPKRRIAVLRAALAVARAVPPFA